MFFQTVLVSLLLILLGLAMTFAGYRFFVILLPIWGFFAGFQFGATIFTNIFGEGFLRTVLSWVVGLLVAIFAAVLAYLFYAVAVVLLAGFVGYQLGAGIPDVPGGADLRAGHRGAGDLPAPAETAHYHPQRVRWRRNHPGRHLHRGGTHLDRLLALW